MSISRYSGYLLYDVRWGDWSLLSLYISLLSGLIVGLQYNPATPYYSATAIDLLVPFGGYFRSLHFYSSQFFFLTSVIHFISIFKKLDDYNDKRRIYLVLTLPVILMLLFTGYVLRGDSTGASAGIIAENILLSIPLIGGLLNELLFSITDHGLTRVYMHHVISFDLLFLYLAWDHLRRYRVKPSKHLIFISLTLSFCLFFAAPLDPESLGVFYITGPWFFLGLQELLRYFHPFLAGVLVPLALVAAVALLSRKSMYFCSYKRFIAIWMIFYLFLSLRALFCHSAL